MLVEGGYFTIKKWLNYIDIMGKLWLNLDRKGLHSTMKDILLASHGKLAEGLKNTLSIFLGPCDNITTVCAYLDDSDKYLDEIREFIEGHDRTNGLIFTDIYGGSVNQQVVKMMIDAAKDIPVISQMNLPLVLQLALEEGEIDDTRLKEVCTQAVPQVVSFKNEDKGSDDDDFFA